MLGTEVFQRPGEQRPGLDLYVSVHREDAHAERRYDFRPLDKIKNPKVIPDPVFLAMANKLKTPEGKRIYGQRACTVEPVFGIIKAVLGFRQFLLRGMKTGQTWFAWLAISSGCTGWVRDSNRPGRAQNGEANSETEEVIRRAPWQPARHGPLNPVAHFPPIGYSLSLNRRGYDLTAALS